MIEQNCSSCVFFDRPKAGECSGQCRYPVPDYLRISGCPYISNPEHSGQSCSAYKNRSQIIQSEIKVDPAHKEPS